MQFRKNLGIENNLENAKTSQQIIDNSVPKTLLEIALESNVNQIKYFHLIVQIIYMNGIPFSKKVKHKLKQWEFRFKS